MKYHLVLISASMITIVNSCGFGNYAIQALYDRFELVRKTNSFVPTSNEIRLRQYSYEETAGINKLSIRINDESMKEFYKTNAANEIETIRGYYTKDNVTLEYKRDKNDELIFEDLSNDKQLGFAQSFEAELPKNVFLDLKTMRQKMFDFQKGLSNDDFGRSVRYFNLSRTFDGFSAYYVENGDGETTVFSKLIDGKETISGQISCNNRNQKYNVFDGKVAVDGEFNPINLLLLFMAYVFSNLQLN